MGGGIASPPSSEWQSPSFVPQPPPSRKGDVVRPSVPTPPAMQQEPPAQKGGSFVPVLTPRTPKQANGKAPIPPRIIDVPAEQPSSMKVPQESLAPVPFVNTVPIGSVPLAPNPFAPYCGAGGELDPAAALCAAAGDAGLSDYCRQRLLEFLGSKSQQTLGSWINAQEICDQPALRRAVGIAEASIAAKTSAGLYRASGGVYSRHAFVVYGMPHGGTVYVDEQPVMGRWLDAGLTRWEVPLRDANPHRMFVYNADRSEARGQDVLDGSTLVWSQMPPLSGRFEIEGLAASPTRRPLVFPPIKGNVFAPKGDGSTMDYRKPSGGMPNYYHASGGWAEDIAAAGGSAADTASQESSLNWGADVAAFNLTPESQSLYRRELAEAAAASPPPTPPPDYGRIIGSIGQAVGGVFAGINTAVDNAERNRLRELEINYANNARSALLALQTRQTELTGEIARLRASAPAAAADPATTALIQRLEAQGAEYRSAIQRQEAAAAEAAKGMGGGTIAAIAIGGVAVLGLGAYALMGGGRRR